jgi:hypothetical protein
MENVKVRNGLSELFSLIFMIRTVKSVVQVRAPRQDKTQEDATKIRGVEVALRSLEFKEVDDIGEKVKSLEEQGKHVE